MRSLNAHVKDPLSALLQVLQVSPEAVELTKYGNELGGPKIIGTNGWIGPDGKGGVFAYVAAKEPRWLAFRLRCLAFMDTVLRSDHEAALTLDRMPYHHEARYLRLWLGLPKDERDG